MSLTNFAARRNGANTASRTEIGFSTRSMISAVPLDAVDVIEDPALADAQVRPRSPPVSGATISYSVAPPCFAVILAYTRKIRLSATALRVRGPSTFMQKSRRRPSITSASPLLDEAWPEGSADRPTG
ncbi:MAG: hypothetical protein U0325_31770 [Polyangiales bacterium]